MNHNYTNYYLTSFIILSLLGLFFLVLIYLYSPMGINPYKSLFIIIFVLICLMGMLAAIYPSHCLRLFKIETVKEYKCKGKLLKNEGHHPDCGEFNDHTYKINNSEYCVGCTGLLIGGFLAILTCFLYLIYGTSVLVFWLGLVIVLASLLQIIFDTFKNKSIRFLSNLGLVWGSSLILVSLLEYRNVFLSVYFLFLILVLIFTRSAVSRKNHDLICMGCEI